MTCIASSFGGRDSNWKERFVITLIVHDHLNLRSFLISTEDVISSFLSTIITFSKSLSNILRSSSFSKGTSLGSDSGPPSFPSLWDPFLLDPLPSDPSGVLGVCSYQP